MSKSIYDKAADDLSPPFNLYAGRDTSEYALSGFGPGLCQQEFADDCDINSIMRRYANSGTVPVFADKQPFYVDNTELMSFQDMQNVLISAREAFMSLPADVRKQFDNDPIAFADFASDSANNEKLREWNMLSDEAVQRLDAAKAAQAAKAAEASQRPAEAAGGGNAEKSAPTSGSS